MDKSCKIAFLIVFIIPLILVLILAWLLYGNNIIYSRVLFGYLDGISVMVVPTLVVITLGFVIKHFFFKH